MSDEELEQKRAKAREYAREYRIKNKEEINRKTRERRNSDEYRKKKSEWDKSYRERNNEELKSYRKESYQKNRERELERMKIYAQKNSPRIKKYQKEHHQKKRLEVLAKIDPDMKCAMCGCDDTRFLEINHIKGGGRKEQESLKKTDNNMSTNFVMLIHKGKRSTEDLNLLCRVCNSIDHLERVFGKTGLRVVWDKQVN